MTSHLRAVQDAAIFFPGNAEETNTPSVLWSCLFFKREKYAVGRTTREGKAAKLSRREEQLHFSVW